MVRENLFVWYAFFVWKDKRWCGEPFFGAFMGQYERKRIKDCLKMRASLTEGWKDFSLVIFSCGLVAHGRRFNAFNWFCRLIGFSYREGVDFCASSFLAVLFCPLYLSYLLWCAISFGGFLYCLLTLFAIQKRNHKFNCNFIYTSYPRRTNVTPSIPMLIIHNLSLLYCLVSGFIWNRLNILISVCFM